MSNIFRHANGDFSHKKTIAICLAIFVVVIMGISFGRALFHPLGDASFIAKIIEWGLGTVAFLCGATGVVDAVKTVRDKLKSGKSK